MKVSSTSATDKVYPSNPNVSIETILHLGELYQISQQGERQIEGLSLYLNKLSGYMTTEMRMYYDADDDKVNFSLRLKENVTIDISHFMDEDDRKLVVFAIHKNRQLLVADENSIDALVENLIKALA